MLIYIDESGSINNHVPKDRYFIITLIRVKDREALKKTYKRFVSSNYKRLMELDREKLKKGTHRVVKKGNKMFLNGKFKELKGSQFDKKMKEKFVDFFSRKQTFEIYYIRVDNKKLTDKICEHTSRVFNYSLRLGIEHFINKKFFEDEDFFIHLDERNEKLRSKYFLENYLNTELFMNGTSSSQFNVQYFDSAENRLIQIADVFSNLCYSNIVTGAYQEEIDKLMEKGILKFMFRFPR